MYYGNMFEGNTFFTTVTCQLLCRMLINIKVVNVNLNSFMCT